MEAPIRNVLYRILHDALLEIRAEAYECDNQKIFGLSDLLHTLPLSLERTARGEASPQDVMQWLQVRAGQKGLDQWLDLRIQEAQRYGREPPPSSVS